MRQPYLDPHSQWHTTMLWGGSAAAAPSACTDGGVMCIAGQGGYGVALRHVGFAASLIPRGGCQLPYTWVDCNLWLNVH